MGKGGRFRDVETAAAQHMRGGRGERRKQGSATRNYIYERAFGVDIETKHVCQGFVRYIHNSIMFRFFLGGGFGWWHNQTLALSHLFSFFSFLVRQCRCADPIGWVWQANPPFWLIEHVCNLWWPMLRCVT